MSRWTSISESVILTIDYDKSTKATDAARLD